MKLATFMDPTGLTQWGVIDDASQTILGAADLEEAYFTYLPETMNEFIEHGDEALLALATAMQKHAEDPVAEPYDLQDVVLLAPFQVTRNIICVGLNYDDHISEFKSPEEAAHVAAPYFFSKRPASVIGPNQPINLHREATNEVDYEGELAVIIGKRGSHIEEDEAWDYVFGYTIINDVTARDLQRRHVQWLLGKSLDSFCPMGPCILVGDKQPKTFTLRTEVNGEVRQEGTTRDLIHSIPSLIATLSNGMTLEPGDVIATGTPSGVGMGFHPPKYLAEDDEVAITISDIGTLRNPVRHGGYEEE